MSAPGTTSMKQSEAQAVAAARREERQKAHLARVAAEMAAKAERKAARAAANAQNIAKREQKMSDVMQGKGMATQAYVNDASIPLAQFAPPPLDSTPAMHFSDPALAQLQDTDAIMQATQRPHQVNEERRLSNTKIQEDQRQLSLLRAEEKKRAYEASLTQIAEKKARRAAEAEERKLMEEANRVAKQQRKEENIRLQRESQRKAMLDKASLEITVSCEQLLAAVQAQIHAFASQAGEVTKVSPISFGGGDVAFTVRFKDPHATQTCLNMTLPPVELSIPLFAKPAVVPACYLNFELPAEIPVTDEQVTPALQTLFSEFGTVLEAKVLPTRLVIIHFQEPEAAINIVDLPQSAPQRTLSLLGHPLTGFEIGKPSPGKRKRI